MKQFFVDICRSQLVYQLPSVILFVFRLSYIIPPSTRYYRNDYVSYQNNNSHMTSINLSHWAETQCQRLLPS